jgi:hypothetical protein
MSQSKVHLMALKKIVDNRDGRKSKESLQGLIETLERQQSKK